MKKIMFVCTGNICRSAMAEFLMKYKLENLQLLNKVIVYSAGTYACDGDLPTIDGLNVMKNIYGIDMSSHKATSIKNSKIQEMDLILCMTNSHKNTLEMVYPDIKDKVFLLKEYVNMGDEIDDPYGYGIETYKACAEEISKCLDLLIDKEIRRD